jgi:hypothetical protein
MLRKRVLAVLSICGVIYVFANKAVFAQTRIEKSQDTENGSKSKTSTNIPGQPVLRLGKEVLRGYPMKSKLEKFVGPSSTLFFDITKTNLGEDPLLDPSPLTPCLRPGSTGRPQTTGSWDGCLGRLQLTA